MNRNERAEKKQERPSPRGATVRPFVGPRVSVDLQYKAFNLLFLILRIQLVLRDTSDNPRFIWISRVSTRRRVGRGNDSEGPRSSGKREEGKRMTGSREEKKEQGGCEVEGWGRERGWKSREREGRREKESVYRLPRNATSRTGAPTCTNTSAAKKAWALYIMIRHFGITTKRAALSHAFLCRRILHLGHVVATQRWKLE